MLLIIALDQGERAAARGASGTLLGLVAFSGFVLVYALLAQRAGWGPSLVGAWAVAAVLALAVEAVGASAPGALLAAVASLTVAFVLMPRGRGGEVVPVVSRWDLPLRMALTALLVVSLSAAAAWLGPLAGGILAALPVLASILAVFVHVQSGSGAVADLLRGMVAGMGGFVAFCALIAALVEPVGIVTAFALAVLAGIAVQVAWARGLQNPALRPTT